MHCWCRRCRYTPSVLSFFPIILLYMLQEPICGDGPRLLIVRFISSTGPKALNVLVKNVTVSDSKLQKQRLYLPESTVNIHKPHSDWTGVGKCPILGILNITFKILEAFVGNSIPNIWVETLDIGTKPCWSDVHQSGYFWRGFPTLARLKIRPPGLTVFLGCVAGRWTSGCWVVGPWDDRKSWFVIGNPSKQWMIRGCFPKRKPSNHQTKL